MANGLIGVTRGRPSIARFVWYWMYCLCVVVLPISSLAAQTPAEVVQRTIKDLLYIQTELKDASRSAQRQWEIEQVVRRAFDYEEMAERSLGDGREKTIVADRRQFIRLFVQVLRDDLADKLRDYSVAQVVYLSERRGADGIHVLMAPAGPEIDARIEFQLVHRSGAWLVIDVIIDGASIVANYQTQFSRILREGSFSDLMEYLKQRAVVAQVTGHIHS